MGGIEGLWTVSFAMAGAWENGGVVILERGRLAGGDGRYYYLGTYELRGGALNGSTRIVHYSGAAATAFGESSDFVVTIVGHWAGTVIRGHIFKPQYPNAKLEFRCLQREALA